VKPEATRFVDKARLCLADAVLYQPLVPRHPMAGNSSPEMRAGCPRSRLEFVDPPEALHLPLFVLH